MMMGLGACAWDDSSIDSLGLRMARGALPEIVSSAEIIGHVADGGARARRADWALGRARSAGLGGGSLRHACGSGLGRIGSALRRTGWAASTAGPSRSDIHTLGGYGRPVRRRAPQRLRGRPTERDDRPALLRRRSGQDHVRFRVEFERVAVHAPADALPPPPPPPPTPPPPPPPAPMQVRYRRLPPDERGYRPRGLGPRPPLDRALQDGPQRAHHLRTRGGRERDGCATRCRCFQGLRAAARAAARFAHVRPSGHCPRCRPAIVATLSVVSSASQRCLQPLPRSPSRRAQSRVAQLASTGFAIRSA